MEEGGRKEVKDLRLRSGLEPSDFDRPESIVCMYVCVCVCVAIVYIFTYIYIYIYIVICVSVTADRSVRGINLPCKQRF